MTDETIQQLASYLSQNVHDFTEYDYSGNPTGVLEYDNLVKIITTFFRVEDDE